MMASWLRRLLLFVLAASTVAAVVAFGTSSVRTGLEQRKQTKQAEHEKIRLDAKIAELTDEVEIRTSAEGVLREALCFGPYVEPETEVYAVVGVSGCVTSQHS